VNSISGDFTLAQPKYTNHSGMFQSQYYFYTWKRAVCGVLQEHCVERVWGASSWSTVQDR